MKIRQITTTEERERFSVPIQAYGFQSSPASKGLLKDLHQTQQYYADHITLVAEEDGIAVADVSAVPMRQNVRGVVYEMAGIAGLATRPDSRRRGHARALVNEVLGMMRDSGYALSTLYPFRASFYERFGFVGLPKAPTVTFAPSGVAWLLDRDDLPGSVRCGEVPDEYDAYLNFIGRLLAERHGFSMLPESRMAQLREPGDRWLATAWVDGAMAGAVTYRVSGFGGDLVADDLLSISPLGRALLLRFFAAHADQVARVTASIPPGEMPELWGTDLESETMARVSFPGSPAPMARVLSLEKLAGMSAGSARVTVRIDADSFIGGSYMLDGTSGVLEVRRLDAEDDADARLTAAGLSALIYGVLDPDDIVVRGQGQIQPGVSALFRILFPRCTPFLFAHF
jgi:predicted N-acetyltransferase YhbS